MYDSSLEYYWSFSPDWISSISHLLRMVFFIIYCPESWCSGSGICPTNSATKHNSYLASWCHPYISINSDTGTHASANNIDLGTWNTDSTILHCNLSILQMVWQKSNLVPEWHSTTADRDDTRSVHCRHNTHARSCGWEAEPLYIQLSEPQNYFNWETEKPPSFVTSWHRGLQLLCWLSWKTEKSHTTVSFCCHG